MEMFSPAREWLLSFEWQGLSSWVWEYQTPLIQSAFFFLGTILLLLLIKNVLLFRLQKLIKGTRLDALKIFPPFFESISFFFYAFVALYITIKWQDMPPRIDNAFDIALIFLAAWEALKSSNNVLQYLVRKIPFLRTEDTTIKVITAAIKCTVWGYGLLLILGQLNIELLWLSKSVQALTLFLSWLVALYIFRNVVLVQLEKLSLRTKTDIDDHVVKILEDISPLFYWFLSLYLSARVLLPTETTFMYILDGIFIVLTVYEVIKVIQSVLEFSFEHVKTLKGDETTLHAIKLVSSIILWSIGLLLILSNIGFDVTTLAASLGIGGIAIALAAQNILSDLFASFSLFFDKPLQIGDYVVLGKDSGTVKKIGLKTTRFQTLQGEELIVSNKELTSSRIQNFKRMNRRRIAFSIGVEYGTPLKKLKKIPSLLEEIISRQKEAESDRIHLKTFGDYNLNFEVVYYVNSREYTEYMDTQQAINFDILEAFEKEGIAIAFPTQTIFVEKN